MRHSVQFAMLQLLRAYKWAVSPMLPPSCRYVPTCSDYAAEAIDRYGAVQGTWMALSRLLRCHPFAPGGYDPVTSKRRDVTRDRSSPTMHDQRPATEDVGVLSDHYLGKA